ncbi:MAG: flagellar motor protein MotD [Pseudomonas profundi]|uniref:flagellar motor protein MotD n=1 Tax=Pseudomonas profundi TaxID=1981513 RepID=UPI00300394D3
MRRRNKHESENHERWLVSYSDFITLLFAFFVVMYSISSVNEGKYKVLSDTLGGAFNQPQKVINPIQMGETTPLSLSPIDGQGEHDGGNETDNDTQHDSLADIAKAMQAAFGDLISAGDIEVRGNELWIEIELSSGLLFPSGDALPLDDAFHLTEKIAGILAPYDNPVHVEGFTDNVPINSRLYPTNWELSAARAASVVRMLAHGGIDPGRMAAVGYGEFRPVADNTTVAGRRANRRVVLLVSRYTEQPDAASPQNRHGVDDMRAARSRALADSASASGSGTGSAN